MSGLEMTLVCGRRPDLLARTLDSFSERLFAHLGICAVHADIDPIFGDEQDHAACRELLHAGCSHATIFEPEAPERRRSFFWFIMRPRRSSRIPMRLISDVM